MTNERASLDMAASLLRPCEVFNREYRLCGRLGQEAARRDIECTGGVVAGLTLTAQAHLRPRFCLEHRLGLRRRAICVPCTDGALTVIR